MLKKTLINPSQFFIRKKGPGKHTQFICESPKNFKEDSEEIESSQARFKYHRKRRQSKTSNVFVECENDLTEELSQRSSSIHIRKKLENETMIKMNEMLEFQKKAEMNRFVYEKFLVLVEKHEESEWKGLEDDFQEENLYKEAFKNNYKEILENSCFLEIVEMSELERSFVDLDLIDKYSIYYRIHLIFLNFRK